MRSSSQTAEHPRLPRSAARLAPDDAALRAEASQIQLTLADFVDETHDTHHPIAGGLYYEDQKSAAKRRAQNFVKERLPKYLGWLENVLARNRKSRGRWLVGSDSHVRRSVGVPGRRGPALRLPERDGATRTEVAALSRCAIASRRGRASPRI